MSDNLYGDWYGYTGGNASAGSDIYGYDYTTAPTDDFFVYMVPDQYGEGTPGATASWFGGSGSGGEAAASANPIMDIVSNAAKWFSDQDPKVKSTMMAIGGSFLAGAMGAKNKDLLAKNSKMTAEASMLNAQTSKQLADSKVAMQKNSQISGTTFGQPRAGGIMSLPYKNKLAERQANPGASGLIGAA